MPTSDSFTARIVIVHVKQVWCRYLDLSNNGQQWNRTALPEFEQGLNVYTVLGQELVAILKLEARNTALITIGCLLNLSAIIAEVVVGEHCLDRSKLRDVVAVVCFSIAGNCPTCHPLRLLVDKFRCHLSKLRCGRRIGSLDLSRLPRH